jgi:hypothetical protein
MAQVCVHVRVTVRWALRAQCMSLLYNLDIEFTQMAKDSFNFTYNPSKASIFNCEKLLVSGPLYPIYFKLAVWYPSCPLTSLAHPCCLPLHRVCKMSGDF